MSQEQKKGAEAPQPVQTRLTDHLRSTPQDAVYAHEQHTPEGMLWSTHRIPVGRFSHEAADLIESLQAERNALIETVQMAANATAYTGDWHEGAPVLRLIEQRDHAANLCNELQARVDELEREAYRLARDAKYYEGKRDEALTQRNDYAEQVAHLTNELNRFRFKRGQQ